MRAPAWLLACLALTAGCTAPSRDADGDGLDELAETTPREIRVHLPNGTLARLVTSDPQLQDTDGDGLDDLEEGEALTDPRDVDTDADGLVDGRDLLVLPGQPLFGLLVRRGIVRDPGDGRFLGELDAGTRPFDWDGDRPFPDGLGDGEELRGWNVSLADLTYTAASDPTSPDTDRDGLSDFEERRRGCDPRLADTDQDGARDALDADCARNLRVRVAVLGIALNRSLDPAGDTDLLLEAQAAGLHETYTQALRPGANNVSFRWTVDVPDDGDWMRLQAQVVLAFWDQDFAGEDPESGVSRQHIRLVGDTNVLSVTLDVFQRRWSTGQGLTGSGPGEAQGTDGSVRFLVEPA